MLKKTGTKVYKKAMEQSLFVQPNTKTLFQYQFFVFCYGTKMCKCLHTFPSLAGCSSLQSSSAPCRFSILFTFCVLTV